MDKDFLAQFSGLTGVFDSAAYAALEGDKNTDKKSPKTTDKKEKEVTQRAEKEPRPASQGFEKISLDAIEFDKTQPRKFFDEESIKSLADSLKANGTLQPIVVRAASAKGNKFIIIAGERRVRAARVAKLVDIPAIVRNDLTKDQILYIQVAENLNRENLQPIEIAKAIKRLVDAGQQKQTVAEKFGKTPGWVSQMLSLLDLPPALLNAYQKGYLTNASRLSRLSSLCKTKGNTKKKIEAWVSDLTEPVTSTKTDEFIDSLRDNDTPTPSTNVSNSESKTSVTSHPSDLQTDQNTAGERDRSNEQPGAVRNIEPLTRIQYQWLLSLVESHTADAQKIISTRSDKPNEDLSLLVERLKAFAA
jgi:ParB/RepB/Spo0J family partition protein